MKYLTICIFAHSGVMMIFSITASLLLGLYGPCASECSEDPSPQVVTPLGTIEGAYLTSYGGRQFAAFRGIPYAQPPIGDLRFEVPNKLLPWEGVLKAKNYGSQCIQYNNASSDPIEMVFGSEDCLYLNVYTPMTTRNYSDDLLPVVFYVHGGGFLFGSGNLYGPRYLLDRAVVLVTINYRLGSFGFLSTEDDVVPGNMGLKDQVMALRWVNDNIQYFGGDASRITLVGQSAGGASVQYHYLTKLTEGLFQRGMSLSGTVLNPWVQDINPLEKAKRLAVILGCSTDDNRSMVDCLKSRPAHQLANALREFTEGAHTMAGGWGPSIERGNDEHTFINREPIDIIISGEMQDLPWVTGVVQADAAHVVSAYDADPVAMEELNVNWETLAPYVLLFNDTIPKSDQPEVARSIKEHYLGDSDFGKETLEHLMRLITDRGFNYDVEKAARYQSRVNRSPVYLYYFSYRGAHSYTEVVTGTNKDYGVCHFDDIAYVLDSFFDPTSTAADLAMQEVLLDFWESYAAMGVPDVGGVEWPSFSKYTTDEISFLHIAGPEEIGIANATNFGEKSFWDTIPFNVNVPQGTDCQDHE